MKPVNIISYPECRKLTMTRDGMRDPSLISLGTWSMYTTVAIRIKARIHPP